MSALNSQFTKLEIGDVGSPVGYIEVEGIATFSGFDGTAAEIDTTTLQSVAKERMMGLQDYGTVSFTGNYLSDDAGQSAMRAAKAAIAKKAFKVTFANNKGFLYEGYVQSASIEGGVDAKVSTTFQVLIDGDVTEF